jgi:hypothetical protein
VRAAMLGKEAVQAGVAHVTRTVVRASVPYRFSITSRFT